MVRPTSGNGCVRSTLLRIHQYQLKSLVFLTWIVIKYRLWPGGFPYCPSSLSQYYCLTLRLAPGHADHLSPPPTLGIRPKSFITKSSYNNQIFFEIKAAEWLSNFICIKRYPETQQYNQRLAVRHKSHCDCCPVRKLLIPEMITAELSYRQIFYQGVSQPSDSVLIKLSNELLRIWKLRHIMYTASPWYFSSIERSF